jgi:hypothetical protein
MRHFDENDVCDLKRLVDAIQQFGGLSSLLGYVVAHESQDDVCVK